MGQRKSWTRAFHFNEFNWKFYGIDGNTEKGIYCRLYYFLSVQKSKYLKEFQTAKQPAHQPYTLKIKIYDPEKRIEIPDENVVNKKTSEKFSVICEHIPKHHFTTYITFVALTIRRAGVSIL